jgi:hypothetical protein
VRKTTQIPASIPISPSANHLSHYKKGEKEEKTRQEGVIKKQMRKAQRQRNRISRKKKQTAIEKQQTPRSRPDVCFDSASQARDPA